MGNGGSKQSVMEQLQSTLTERRDVETATFWNDVTVDSRDNTRLVESTDDCAAGRHCGKTLHTQNAQAWDKVWTGKMTV